MRHEDGTVTGCWCAECTRISALHANAKARQRANQKRKAEEQLQQQKQQSIYRQNEHRLALVHSIVHQDIGYTHADNSSVER